MSTEKKAELSKHSMKRLIFSLRAELFLISPRFRSAKRLRWRRKAAAAAAAFVQCDTCSSIISEGSSRALMHGHVIISR